MSHSSSPKSYVPLDQFLDGIISRFFTHQFVNWRDHITPRLLGSFLRDRLFLLRTRSDRRLGVVGQDLCHAKHRELVAVAALAARILAAALLERDDLGTALVLKHFDR